MPNLRPRTCRQCGAVFDGGPHAWYCPVCREDRRREADRACHARIRAGKTRLIGSEDICAVCGKSYTVMGGKQKYCPACASDAVAEIDREQGLDYYKANADKINPVRNIKRRRGPRTCVVCGNTFDVPTARTTCGKECSRELRRQAMRRADAKRSPRARGEDMTMTKPKRGGARPGSGRPRAKVKTPTVLVSFRLSGEEVDKIIALAAADGATVHAWCQDAVRRAMAGGE